MILLYQKDFLTGKREKSEMDFVRDDAVMIQFGKKAGEVVSLFSLFKTPPLSGEARRKGALLVFFCKGGSIRRSFLFSFRKGGRADRIEENPLAFPDRVQAAGGDLCDISHRSSDRRGSGNSQAPTEPKGETAARRKP